MIALTAILLVTAFLAVVILMMHGSVGTSLPRADRVDVPLPRPGRQGGMSLAEALAGRRSQREFTEKALSPEQVAQLCWAAQGITDDAQGYRTAPSAGALFPLTVFLVDSHGVHEYEPQRHALSQVLAGDLRSELQAAALDQPCVGTSPLCMVITMDVARSASKYGRRAERYCLLEAGHVAQNLLLQATAMGLGGVPVGAFEDRKVATLLRLPQSLHPVYLVPLGYSRGK